MTALCERYRELSGLPYGFRGGQDARAVSDLLSLADQQPETQGAAAPAEVLRRWGIGLLWRWGNGQAPVQTLTALAQRWNECAGEETAPPRRPAGGRDPLTGVAYS